MPYVGPLVKWKVSKKFQVSLSDTDFLCIQLSSELIVLQFI